MNVKRLNTILHTESVSKVYDDSGVPVEALKQVSLSIETGDYAVLAGPSGSGKTTLLNLLGALDKPTTGRVLFNGNDIGTYPKNKLSEFRLNSVGFVFQAYNLIPVLTAAENVEFTMVLQGVPEQERRRRALETLDELGIRELADKRPNEMSGGQQQRVAVGRAIVTHPELILADEPTANLDSATSASLLDLMQTMNAQKRITFLFSSHDPQVIERGRRVIRLKDGRIDSDSRASL